MKRWFLVKMEDVVDTVSDIGYHVPAVFTMIGRVIGFALMFGGGFLIGQVLRGVFNAFMMYFGLM